MRPFLHFYGNITKKCSNFSCTCHFKIRNSSLFTHCVTRHSSHSTSPTCRVVFGSRFDVAFSEIRRRSGEVGVCYSRTRLFGEQGWRYWRWRRWLAWKQRVRIIKRTRNLHLYVEPWHYVNGWLIRSYRASVFMK